MVKIAPIQSLKAKLPAAQCSKSQLRFNGVNLKTRFGVDDENGFQAKGKRLNKLA